MGGLLEEKDSAYPASDYEDDDEEENEEARTRRLLGFMFGNVDDAGVLDEEYLDQDAKEHMDALADQLGPSLEDLELSTKRKGFGSRPEPDEEHEDYAKKAEGAIDYEDIQEEYEGPEVQVLGQDEHFYAQAALAVPLQKPGSSFVAEEDNYDEDDDAAEDTREVDHVEAEPVVVPSTEAQVVVVPEKEDVAPVPGSISPKDLGREESVKHDMAGEEVGKEESQIPEISGVREQSPQEDPSSTKSHQQDATKIELPVLCEEDGKEVLRFSELFGVREPYWVLGCRKGRPRRHLFKEQSCTAEHDETDVEDDEETIFQSSSVGQEIRHLISNPEMSKDESHQDILEHGDSSDDNESDSDSDYERMDLMRGVRVDFCPAEPMKVSSEDCEEILRWRENLPEANFDPVHQQDWETDILWDRRNLQARSPHGEVLADFRAERDSDSEQEGTSFSGANIIGHGQHTKPRDVVSWSETINLKPWVNPEPLSRFPVDSDERLDGFGTRRHPQMLRLESLDLGTIPNSQDRNVDLHPGELGARLSKLNLVCSEKNREFASGSWLDSVLWNSSSPTREVQYKPSQVTYDLQDRNMVFEIASDIWDQDLRAHAAAVILPPSGMKNSGDNGSEALVSSASSLNRFNISNDKYYTNKKVQHQQKSHAKKRAVHGVKVMHSLPAIKLQTMKPKLTNKDLANFHRPKAVWYPHHNEVAAKEQGKLAVTGPMKVILKTLGGKGSKLHVDASETVEVLKVKAAKKLGDLKASEVTKVLYTGKELEEGRTFAEQQVPPNSVLHLVRTKVYPWPKAQRLPGENKPIRPPGAFKKKSELSVKDGHVALMEYCEERPLLLSNVGMGARLSTYYRKLTPTDSTAVNLRNERGSWVGFPLPLEPTEDSPFLGDIRPGDKVSSLETNMYRSPAFGHKVAHTDFLLVRSAKGKLSLRRIDSLHVVGQQEPHLEVLTPTSKGVQNYIGQRLLVHVYREFRNNEKPTSIPRVQAEELISQFPSLTEGFIRKRLKHCADMQKGTGGEMWWVMRRNFRIPSEEELRRMVSPEMVCTCESMQAGLHHLKRMGVQKLTQASGLSAAMNMLPDEAITLAAASHIERELQITPWNLSSNFVSATLQGRGSLERLEITGAGDPSGRGLGFSYLRVATKPPNVGAIVEKKAAVARGGGAVTGTDADLRRLSMDAAREVLLKFKVSEAQIDKLTRWHRIALVRKLSSEQAASLGKVGVAALNKFARGQRMSFLQLQQQTREKCQEIWDRQAQSLAIAEGEDSESDGEANGDLDSFAGDLENLLEAEEGEDGEERKGRREGMRGLGGRRRALQAQKEEEMEDEEAEAAELRRMLLEDDEADEEHTKKNGGSAGKESKTPVNTKQTGASGSGTTAAAKKKKRVLKRIIRTKRADGTYTSKEVIITDPKEVAAYLAKKAQSKVSGMKPVGDKPVVPKKGATKPKKEKKVQVPKIVAKVKATVKKVSKESAGKEKPGRDGQQFVCGACGQLGHMRTNKKCPLYMEDADGNAQRQEITSVGAVPERPGIKITIKKKKVEELHIAKLKKPSGTSKVTVKKTVKTSRRPLGKIPALKIKIPSSGNLCDTKVDRNGSKLEGSRIAGLPQDGVDAGPSLVEVDVKEAETGFSHQPLKATKLRVPKKSKKKKAKDKKPSKQQTQSKGQSSGARGADEDTGTGIQSAKRNQPAKRKEKFDQHLADVKVQRLEMEREGAERTTELKHLERGNLEREQLRRETEVQNWERERQALMEREREEQEEREREEQEERDREEQIEREREHQILERERMKKAREQMERDREQFLEKERLRKIREQKKKDRQLERQRDKELMEKQLQMEKEVKEREEQERIEAQRLKELRDKKKQRIREEKERVERQKEAEMRVLRELEMERERVKQERLERERQERERERVREKMERERLELERMEKERQERERLERQERERLEDEKLAREKERKQKSRQKVLNEKLRKKKEEEERMLELQKEKVREQRHQGEKPKGRARVTISAEELRTPREVPREPTVEKDRVRVGKKRTRSVAGAGSQRTSDPPKRQRTRGGGEVVLANMFEAIVNILVKSKVAYLFVKPVSKKEAPDYLDYVKTPMDLGTIRDKARKMRYKSRLDFRTDVEQIVLNAHEYNDNRNPGIPPLAEALLELCDGELRSRRTEFEDAEDAVERFDDDEPYTPNGRPSPPLDRRRRQRAI